MSNCNSLRVPGCVKRPNCWICYKGQNMKHQWSEVYPVKIIRTNCKVKCCLTCSSCYCFPCSMVSHILSSSGFLSIIYSSQYLCSSELLWDFSGYVLWLFILFWSHLSSHYKLRRWIRACNYCPKKAQPYLFYNRF